MMRDFRLASVLLVPFGWGERFPHKWEYVFERVAQPDGLDE